MAKPTAQNLRYPLQELQPIAVAGDSSPIFWQWTYTNEYDTTRTMLISLHPGGQFCCWEISGTLSDVERYAIMQKIQQETESNPAALTFNQAGVRLSYRAGANFMLMPKQEMWRVLEEYFSDDHALFCEMGKIDPAGRKQLYRDIDRLIVVKPEAKSAPKNVTAGKQEPDPLFEPQPDMDSFSDKVKGNLWVATAVITFLSVAAIVFTKVWNDLPIWKTGAEAAARFVATITPLSASIVIGAVASFAADAIDHLLLRETDGRAGLFPWSAMASYQDYLNGKRAALDRFSFRRCWKAVCMAATACCVGFTVAPKIGPTVSDISYGAMTTNNKLATPQNSNTQEYVPEKNPNPLPKPRPISAATIKIVPMPLPGGKSDFLTLAAFRQRFDRTRQA